MTITIHRQLPHPVSTWRMSPYSDDDHGFHSDAPLGFEDAVENQPDIDEENRRRFPQMPMLAFHPWEGIEQEHLDDDEDDDDDTDDEHEMNALEDNLDHEQEQLNRLQGNIDVQTCRKWHAQNDLCFYRANTSDTTAFTLRFEQSTGRQRGGHGKRG